MNAGLQILLEQCEWVECRITNPARARQATLEEDSITGLGMNAGLQILLEQCEWVECRITNPARARQVMLEEDYDHRLGYERRITNPA